MSDLKIKALELAIQAPGSHGPDEVVKRAHAYHSFLSGGTAPAATKPAAAAPTQAAKPAATTNGAAAPAQAATKPATKPAAAPKTAAAPATKPAAQAATKPATKPAAAPPAEKKSPQGKTLRDVRMALSAMMANGAKQEDCIRLMSENGNGATKSTDLKPEFYDAVIEAAQAETESDGAATEVGDGELDPTASPESEDLGALV